MTIKQLRARRSFLIRELAAMSRDWSRYTAIDWKPLEDELRVIEAKLSSRPTSAKRHHAKIADHIDGYDRDDLGESPDY